ncbi:hypothetical protein [Rossellomorea sp. NPDC077527]|uniref:hypothetical protein n=1 Tax=Rossellomorea sp. NPDC077527 TaxID=3364510 RepID=UPI0037CB714B
MELIIKVILYIVFLIGALYFYFGGTKKAARGHNMFIKVIGVVLISYFYWFHIQTFIQL